MLHIMLCCRIVKSYLVIERIELLFFFVNRWLETKILPYVESREYNCIIHVFKRKNNQWKCSILF